MLYYTKITLSRNCLDEYKYNRVPLKTLFNNRVIYFIKLEEHESNIDMQQKNLSS